MNITFFVGNGFDLNLGLKTDYASFLKYHKDKKCDDIISQSINQNITLWADLERQLGTITREATDENIEAFIESKCAIDESLSDYLSGINNSNDVIFGDKGAVEFRDRLISFSKEFSETEVMHYDSIVKNADATIRYRFVSFNYTSFLDRIISKAKMLNPFSSHSAKNTSFSDCIEEPIHAHGTLADNVLLGVNDISQLEGTENVKKRLAPYMLKPDMNTALGRQTISHIKEIINSSQYIIVYGMSLGETDLIWWKYLSEWLKAAQSRRLVLHVYDQGITSKSGTRTLRLQDKKRNQFIQISQCKNPEISRQIIIVANSKIFTYNTIHVRAQQTDERAEAV